MKHPVSVSFQGEIAVVTVSNPPVNAASHAVRAGLLDTLQAVDREGKAQVIVLIGAGRNFIAGADIREFGRPLQPPGLPDVVIAIEAFPVPVLCVVHGPTLGGGLEVAMAAHRRIALPGAKLGLPEINLGLMPGAGGTQRAPRLVGVKRALDMILSGKPVDAETALHIGLVDALAETDDPHAACLAEAERILAGSVETRRTGTIAVTSDPDEIAATRERLAKTSAHLFSPHRCVDAVEMSVLPVEEGMKRERALFQECMESPQRQGLVHAFFAERAVGRIPEKDFTPRDISHVGVVGGGTMGTGIVTACLQAGLQVTLVEQDGAALERGRQTVADHLDGGVKRGKLSVIERDAALAERLSGATDFGALAKADLVIEAVFEDMALKKTVFETLDRVCRDGAIFASNTSYLDINQMAAATSRAADVIGLHFFSPAHVMRLVEVVVPDKVSGDAVATGFALAKRLGKVAVRAGVCDGFIGNRILSHYRKAADYMMMDGASPWQIDGALEDFGFAMGPFAVGDLSGLDISWANRKRLAPTRDRKERYIAVADRICENGWFGRKSGKGWYLYEEDGNRAPNPAVEKIIAEEQRAAGVTPRIFSDEEIVTRYLTAMVNEGARVVEDGIALRPIDVDAVFLLGYGFPRHIGGPLNYADQTGLDKVLNDTARFADDDEYFWRQPALISDLAGTGRNFADLN